MNSSPASSAIRVIATMSSQSARQRSGARLIVSPPSQFALNTPSLKRLGPNRGLLVRDGSIGVLYHRVIARSKATKRAREADSPVLLPQKSSQAAQTVYLAHALGEVGAQRRERACATPHAPSPASLRSATSPTAWARCTITALTFGC